MCVFACFYVYFIFVWSLFWSPTYLINVSIYKFLHRLSEIFRSHQNECIILFFYMKKFIGKKWTSWYTGKKNSMHYLHLIHCDIYELRSEWLSIPFELCSILLFFWINMRLEMSLKKMEEIEISTCEYSFWLQFFFITFKSMIDVNVIRHGEHLKIFSCFNFAWCDWIWLTVLNILWQAPHCINFSMWVCRCRYKIVRDLNSLLQTLQIGILPGVFCIKQTCNCVHYRFSFPIQIELGEFKHTSWVFMCIFSIPGPLKLL